MPMPIFNRSRRLLNSHTIFFSCFVAVLFFIGVSTGYMLAGHQKLVQYKLLNVIGIFYGLFGIVVLSEFVIRNDALKHFVVHWVAGLLLWAHSIIPLGAIVGAGFAQTLPSSALIAKFFASFFAYSLLVLAFLDFSVFNPKVKAFQTLATRTQVFGLILLISGGVVQLTAALQDLNG